MVEKLSCQRYSQMASQFVPILLEAVCQHSSEYTPIVVPVIWNWLKKSRWQETGPQKEKISRRKGTAWRLKKITSQEMGRNCIQL